jgi:uncharacterized protein (TIGR02679 family)
MTANCSLCGGACAGAELGPLIGEQLSWLWEQIGRAADRRGDAALVEGTLSIRAPKPPEARAAVGGLIGRGILRPDQKRTIDLAQLTTRLRVRGPQLTPGAVAAHALGRRLALRADAEERRRNHENELEHAFAPLQNLSFDMERIRAGLRRTGWIARLQANEAPIKLAQLAVAVISALPQDTRVDRRRLAAQVTGDPHALDHGCELAGLVLAVLVAAGKILPRQRPRAAWGAVHVDCDDVIGGLTAIGILPSGWSVPRGNAVTLPPRVLARCEWPRSDGSWVFVTENPSVATAAADLAAGGADVRLICTSGTPSPIEIAAVARLSAAGWRVAVRADFDAAGLGHVEAFLSAMADAVPWRMSAADYLESVSSEPPAAKNDHLPDTKWDPQLAEAMRERGLPAYEEALLVKLLDDLERGVPSSPGDRVSLSPELSRAHNPN